MPSPVEKVLTLEDLSRAWADPKHPKPLRCRMVGLNSLGRHSGTSLENVALDVAEMQRVAAAVNPRAIGLTLGYWASVRSACKTAIDLYNNNFQPLPEKQPLSAKWLEFWGHLANKYEKNIMSSLVHGSNRQGIEPQEIDDNALSHFEQTQGSKRSNEREKYRRGRRKLWNVVREGHPDLGLASVTVPSIEYRRTRIPYGALTQELRSDIDRYLHWCSGANRFRKNSRKRFLSARTLIHHKNYIHAAADALARSGVEIGSICRVSDLLVPDRVREICDVRFDKANRCDTAYNFELGRVLVQLARWVGVDEAQLTEVRDIVSEQERPPMKMTDKNTRTVSFFQGPKNLSGLVQLPARLFDEVRHGKGNKRNRLAKLQAGIAIGILTSIPIRRANLAALQFGENIELIAGQSTLRIPRDEVKNKQPIEFDIPPELEALLNEYRDHFVPTLTAVKTCQSVFIDTQGRIKGAPAVSLLVKHYTKRYLGREINAHAFRHLGAKNILSNSPGNYSLVQDLLAHTNPMTTKNFYTEPDTKTAGRYHHRLLMKRIKREDLD